VGARQGRREEAPALVVQHARDEEPTDRERLDVEAGTRA
jgi:hypothetical protein